MDPLGNVPLFLTAIRRVPDSRKTRVIMRELVIALFIMLFFFFFGKYFLKALDLDVSAMAIGGGIILFIIGLQMIFPSRSLASGSGDAAEPFIVPLAVPLVAGPSTLTTVMLLSAHNEGTLAGWVGVLFVSHHPEDLDQADHIYFIEEGKIMSYEEELSRGHHHVEL